MIAFLLKKSSKPQVKDVRTDNLFSAQGLRLLLNITAPLVKEGVLHSVKGNLLILAVQGQ